MQQPLLVVTLHLLAATMCSDPPVTGGFPKARLLGNAEGGRHAWQGRACAADVDGDERVAGCEQRSLLLEVDEVDGAPVCKPSQRPAQPHAAHVPVRACSLGSCTCRHRAQYEVRHINEEFGSKDGRRNHSPRLEEDAGDLGVLAAFQALGRQHDVRGDVHAVPHGDIVGLRCTIMSCHPCLGRGMTAEVASMRHGTLLGVAHVLIVENVCASVFRDGSIAHRVGGRTHVFKDWLEPIPAFVAEGLVPM